MRVTGHEQHRRTVVCVHKLEVSSSSSSFFFVVVVVYDDVMKYLGSRVEKWDALGT
jgi:hypothetical protein